MEITQGGKTEPWTADFSQSPTPRWRFILWFREGTLATVAIPPLIISFPKYLAIFNFHPKQLSDIKSNIHCTVFFSETGTGYSCVFIKSWPSWPHKKVLLTKVHKQNKPLFHLLLCLAVTSLTQSYFHFVIDVTHELFNTTYLGTGISCKITTKCRQQCDCLFAFLIENALTVNVFYIWASKI